MSGKRFLIEIVRVPAQAAFGVRAAARYLAVSPNTLRRRADEGLIPVRRDEHNNRVFLLRDLDAYLNALPLDTARCHTPRGRSVDAERGRGGTG